WHDEARQRHGCEPVISGEEPCRVHRNGESRSGQDQFCFRRGGYFAAHVRRAFASNGRHQAYARALSGTAPAMTDLLGGQIPVLFDNLPDSIQQIQAGRIRALGVTTAKRVDTLPDVPAIAETVPGYEVFVWYGICAPKGTPPEVVEK